LSWSENDLEPPVFQVNAIHRPPSRRAVFNLPADGTFTPTTVASGS
jgi:hypothetical protein